MAGIGPGYNPKYFTWNVAPLSSSKPLLLIVDDDPLICESLGFAFNHDYDVLTTHSRSQALSMLRQLRQPPKLALIDLGLPPTPHKPDEGFGLVSDLLKHNPDVKIIVLSGQNDDENARHARTLGAIEFFGKPCDPQRIKLAFSQALALDTGSLQNVHQALIGESQAVQRLRLQLGQYANLPYPVLIEGESGSGKDIVASHYLHQQTQRSERPFLALNCAAISPTLLEPTLFGYAKGAFTGAHAAKPGYFEEADNGTLFLDEIGELPLELQPKLLRVLENGEYQRVGETQTRVSSARIVAATNRDLRQEVRAGRFRIDLFHRLSVFTVCVPSVRDTGLDRLLLLEHFKKTFAETVGAPPFELAPDAQTLWLDYAFPGNVRELRNIVLRLTARYAGNTVSASQLGAELDYHEHPADTTSTSDTTSIRTAARQHLEITPRFELDNALLEWERAYIEIASELCNGNMSQIARRLGINRTTLYNRMEVLKRR